MKIRCWITAAIWLFGGISMSGPSVAIASPTVDLRVIIDTSGSMRHTDPSNLRIPALRLVVGLLPRGSRAGVYAFDERVVTIVPPGEVTEAWQERARRSAERVNSRGQWTDIGMALEKAMADWSGPPSGDVQRKILLMSDGMEDISKDPAVNAAAREKVLTQTLPLVRAMGASVYTIALSDEADQELLRKLATDSNGWAEHATDAGLLQRLFLRIFSQAVPRDTLPLKDNRFVVDGTVHELTLVVLHSLNSKPTILLAPDGTRYSRATPPAQGRWAAELGYDMITVGTPVPGSWQVVADADPDNRVMVVTDVGLEMDAIPPSALVGEHLDLTAHLQAQGKIVTDHDFLTLLNFTVTRTTEGGDHDMRPLHDDGVTPDVTTGDGIFSTSLDDLLHPGTQELRIAVEGATFQREARYSLRLFPAGVETKLEGGEKGGARTVVVRPIPEVVNPGSLAVTATLTDPAGAAHSLALARGPDGAWSAPLPTSGGRYVLVFQARGHTPQGRPLSFLPPPLSFEAGAPLPPPAAPPPPQHPPTEVPAAPSSPVSWTTIGVVFLILNSVIALGIWFGLRWWRQRNAAIFLDLAEKIEPPSIPL